MHLPFAESKECGAIPDTVTPQSGSVKDGMLVGDRQRRVVRSAFPPAYIGEMLKPCVPDLYGNIDDLESEI
jgi:hypothetical protein